MPVQQLLEIVQQVTSAVTAETVCEQTSARHSRLGLLQYLFWNMGLVGIEEVLCSVSGLHAERCRWCESVHRTCTLVKIISREVLAEWS